MPYCISQEQQVVHSTSAQGTNTVSYPQNDSTQSRVEQSPSSKALGREANEFHGVLPRDHGKEAALMEKFDQGKPASVVSPAHTTKMLLAGGDPGSHQVHIAASHRSALTNKV
jgi:hypothetical protein